ncbi:hypothetical protein GCM10010269_27190 [Streptomyces humidus]|uniref:Uncharacterized protein n=1 Tax=Streptomyces humidus TaxID=52259 RepID=A0A918FUU5_9ACTN|nr:hypothetical protein GCM10010269_27190 [Streptomyces humidus]
MWRVGHGAWAVRGMPCVWDGAVAGHGRVGSASVAAASRTRPCLARPFPRPGPRTAPDRSAPHHIAPGRSAPARGRGRDGWENPQPVDNRALPEQIALT